ncbi:MAG TPA: DUF3108 domain-containing protein [Kiritimatiellia bacterium]|nr:DUF3108 domain-containing protein [Kiritimatiellia bacterium]
MKTKHAIRAACAALLLGGLIFARTAHADDSTAPAGAPLWFNVGEELVYKLHWGVMGVGETRVTTEWVEEDGRRLIAIRYRTRSNSFLDRIYRVDDTIEAIIEPTTFLPVRFTKTLNEGRYKTDEVTTFDHAAGKAYWRHRTKDRTKEFEIEPDTRDLVTFMYFMRQREFQPGETAQYRVMADEKVYDVTINAGKVDTLKMDGFGRVRSIRITPEASFEGLFVRKGKMTLWVSQDARRIATRIQVTVPVADIHINLQEVKGPGNDSWVRRDKSQSQVQAEARAGAWEQTHVH